MSRSPLKYQVPSSAWVMSSSSHRPGLLESVGCPGPPGRGIDGPSCGSTFCVSLICMHMGQLHPKTSGVASASIATSPVSSVMMGSRDFQVLDGVGQGEAPGGAGKRARRAGVGYRGAAKVFADRRK